MLKDPIIPACGFIAPTAAVVGDVTLGERGSVYFSAVLRGDEDAIVVGDDTNIQDGAVLHGKTVVGKGCTIGHNAIVHACTLGDNTLVGMGAIILNGAKVGSNCIIGAGALVTLGMEIPDGMMAFGSPAKVRRPLTEEEVESNRWSVGCYEEHREYFKEMYE